MGATHLQIFSHRGSLLWTINLVQLTFIFLFSFWTLYQSEFSQENKSTVKIWKGVREPERQSLSTLYLKHCWKLAGKCKKPNTSGYWHGTSPRRITKTCTETCAPGKRFLLCNYYCLLGSETCCCHLLLSAEATVCQQNHQSGWWGGQRVEGGRDGLGPAGCPCICPSPGLRAWPSRSNGFALLAPSKSHTSSPFSPKVGLSQNHIKKGILA